MGRRQHTVDPHGIILPVPKRKTLIGIQLPTGCEGEQVLGPQAQRYSQALSSERTMANLEPPPPVPLPWIG